MAKQDNESRKSVTKIQHFRDYYSRLKAIQADGVSEEIVVKDEG